MGIASWWLPLWLQAQPGLKGEYYTGTNFDRKVFTRIDPAISFNWLDHTPGPGMPESYYSIRWTGKLLAPATGEYTFSAKVDDGIRVWVGNKKVMDSWQLNDSKNFTGSITLQEGRLYDLRVDYFNDMLEGEIQLFWQRPDTKKPSLNPFATSSEPIAGKYFFQKDTPNPVTVVKPTTPTKPVAAAPVVTVSTPPKVTPKKRLTIVTLKPTLTPPPPKRAAVVDTVTASVVPVSKPVSDPKPESKAGTTFVLRNVQFEQSSYILLPESSTELDQLVAMLKTNPLWHIDVAGHTDNVGDPRLNLALSENRAKVVSTYLTRRGIADDRIMAIGYGGTRPIAENISEGERSKNRRVEITIK